MILTKTVKIKWNNKNKNYYILKGYNFTDIGEYVEVLVEDLSKTSKEKIEVKCDYCGKNYFIVFADHIRSFNTPVKKNACKKCTNLKTKELEEILSVDICIELNKEGKNDIHIFDELFKDKQISPLIEFYASETSHIPFMCEKHENIFFATIQRIKNKKTNCSQCRSERAHQIKRFSDDFVLKTITDKGYFVKDDFSYNSSKGYMTVYCIKHPEVPISVMYSNFINQKACCRKCISENRMGEGGSNWRGGKSSKSRLMRGSKEYEEWKNKVFERDSYVCQCCGYSDGKMLEAHHISNFSSDEEKRFDINNGITLCKKCHNFKFPTSFHYIYGVSNNTEEQLCEYLELNKKILPRTYTQEEKSNIYSWAKNIKFNCELCGKEKIQSEYFYKKSQHHFCSVQCSAKYRKGKKR